MFFCGILCIFAPQNSVETTKKSVDNMSLDYLAFMVVHGLCVGILVMIGLYLIVSVRSAFQEDVEPNALVRKTAGWNALLWAMTFVITLLYPVFEHLEFFAIVPRLNIMLCLMVVPGVALLLLSLLQMQHAIRRYFWLHVLVPTSLIVWYLFAPSQLQMHLSFAYWLIYALVFALWFYRQEHRYRRHLRDLYSDLEHHEIRWIYQIIVLLIIYLGLFILAHVTENTYAWHYVSYAYCIGLWALLTHHVDCHECAVRFWVGAPEAPQSEVEAEVSLLSTEAEYPADCDTTQPEPSAPEVAAAEPAAVRDLNWIGERLRERCEEPKLYLHHDLGIDVLATHLGTNRTYIGRYLASKGMTYYGYINGLRIGHARQMIEQDADTTISTIAFQSGFKSDSTFRRAFMEIEGCTPSEYAKRIKQLHT